MKAFSIGATILVSCLLVASSATAQEEDHDEHHYFEEIIVSAMPLRRTVEELAQPASVLEGDKLARQQSTSIGESLATELGVSATYFGPVASRPVIRGQYGERVTVLSNGLDSLDASALSEDHAVSTDSILADRVEIVRGPATLLYGSGAAGGIVNVVDSRIHEAPAEAAMGGAVSLGTDSATGRRSGAIKAHFGGSNLIGYLDYFRRDTEDVQIPGYAESSVLREQEEAAGEEEHDAEEESFGRIENTDSKTEGGAAALSFVGERGFVGLSVSKYQTNYGIPGHGHHEEEGEAGAAEGEEEAVRIDLDQTRYDLRGSLDLGWIFKQGNLKIANNRYEHVELEGAAIGTIFENDATDFRIDFEQKDVGSLAGSVGVQYKSIDFNAIGEEAFVPPSQTEQLGLFVFEELALGEQWVLQGSARVERQEIKVPDAADYNDTALGASIGAIWSIRESIILSGNLSLTERHPNSTELYADGPHLAVQRFERGSVTLGNGFLDKEVSTNLDLTLRGDLERVQWSITGFLNDVKDYIVLSPTDQIEDDLQVYEFKQTDADLVGFEAELLFDIVKAGDNHLHARLFSDYVRAEEKSTGNNLPRIPPLRYGIGLHYTHRQLDASIQATLHDDQDRVAENELPTEGYTMLDAEASYRFENNGVLLFARGTNLTNEDARRHTSPLKDIAPLPGRSLQLGFRWDF
jgi:iron complex outermembrane receptor protein